MSNERGAAEYLRAVIYVLAGAGQDRAQRECLDACEQRRRRVVGLVVDHTNGDNWSAAIEMCLNGEADVIVVDDRDKLPFRRVARVESAVDVRHPTDAPPSQRRPKNVRWR